MKPHGYKCLYDESKPLADCSFHTCVVFLTATPATRNTKHTYEYTHDENRIDTLYDMILVHTA